jgi:hypothetical protein
VTPTADNTLAFLRFSLTKDAHSALIKKFGSRESLNAHYIDLMYKDAGVTPPSRETQAERKARIEREKLEAAKAEIREQARAEARAEFRAEIERLEREAAERDAADAKKVEPAKADTSKTAQPTTQKPAQGARR